MLSIVDEILCVDEAQFIYLSFTLESVEIKMSKILQAIADGKKVEGLIVKVSGVYPNAQFFIICMIDGKMDGEFADEALCDELISKIGGVDQSEYQPYKVHKKMTIMREAGKKNGSGNSLKKDD
ncbi:hypothetical protein [Paraburkholderia tropica]|uniref:hypothetical protein n=1 Tax=Paraburkholderia tropica TaxID=92647 RepID=UPI003D2E9D00